ncbi:hypothetical protein [Streptomyces sp. NPDC020362]|uniref:hypothetical protein n=1 Tax=unclassified Streptomyces TaxID=2593676 RepID=UPI000A89D6D2
MRTLNAIALSGPAGSTSQDHRFALLTARAGLEPDLAERYFSDPLSVLVEFGLSAAEPVYLTEPADGEADLVIEDLDRLDTAAADICYFCTLETDRQGETALA